MPSQSATVLNACVVDTSKSSHARLRPVPLNAVKLEDGFWAPRRRLNRSLTIPSQFRRCEETGRIDNFRRASGKKDGPFQGIYFNDSDVYKWLEAAAWALAEDPNDAELKRMLDLVADEIAAAQQPDGYLNTYFMFEKAKDRYSNLKDMHELYCMGHFIQAAVAHHRATGEAKLLDVATRLAAHLCRTFGPASEGKLECADGHEEIEMALVELARETGDAKYLKLAQFFVDVRGHGKIGGSHYVQDHACFCGQDHMTGHAVRHVYLACGAADVCLETGDAQYRVALEALWTNMTRKHLYLTGGVGARWEGEAFGRDYELPNERAYTETCAAIGGIMWNARMLALTGETRFADQLETMLYNGMLAGLALDGEHYFYQNPLADDGTHRREKWFGCACCPPNVARLLASLPGYFYGSTGDAIYAHLYATSSATLDLPGAGKVELVQRTQYPWDGRVEFEVRGAGAFALNLRIPAWCEAGARVSVNGKPVDAPVQAGTYLELRRAWKRGDTVVLELPMPAQRVEQHPFVEGARGQVALQRGPLVYCVEQADNPGLDPREITLPDTSEINARKLSELLGGVVQLEFEAHRAALGAGWENRLYRSVKPGAAATSAAVTVRAIPYYAWANREAGRMQVWLKRG